MAGLEYRVDPTREEGERIWDLRFAGEPLDLHASFTVAINNYRAAGGGGFPHLRDAEVLWTSSTEVTEMICEHLSGREVWRPQHDANWCIASRLIGEKPLPETQ
jgi:2',3'-cyclic-nucleotide 2'-phosphodiesterase/3'-nucleotidase